MGTKSNAIVFAIAATSTSCVEPSAYVGPSPSAMLLPRDATTAASAEEPIGLEILSNNYRINVANVDMIASMLVLESWPSQVPVETNVEWTDTHVHLRPSSPLASGWYVLRLTSSEPSTRFDLSDGWSTVPGSTTGLTHFHVGPQPLLVASIGSSSLDMSTLTIRGTEPLTLVDSVDVDSLVELEVGGAAIGCAYEPQFETPVADLEQAGELRFGCAHVALDALVVVHVHPGIVGLQGGQPATDFAGRTEATMSWTPSADGPNSPRIFDPASPPGEGR
ncbi:MAG: hypothetical protein U0234_23270 [Sandaracinus sp.]